MVGAILLGYGLAGLLITGFPSFEISLAITIVGAIVLTLEVSIRILINKE